MNYYQTEIALYFLFIAAVILTVYAQIKVSTTFKRFSHVYTGRGMTAAEVARRMLNDNGLSHVRIERVGGNLTDHYSPREEVLRLSDSVYDSSSASAVGVAAHEAGHAIQYSENYFPVKLRSALVPVTNFASRGTWILIFLGVLFYYTTIGYYLMLVGVGLFAVTTLFQLVTLPCEFDASKRALASLEATGNYTRQELRASKKVLSAAALTYVAALLVSVLQLMRLIVRFSGRRRR
ncbi:MAG: zinc metallopeptidase [Clostridia bacterium]|nr:zinc metallopeptidase [Clostridia bacterium]